MIVTYRHNLKAIIQVMPTINIE